MQMKQFVKAKPLNQPKDPEKEKPSSHSFARESTRKNNKKYELKPFQQNIDPREHIKMLLNQFKIYERNPNIITLCAKFPKFFNEKPSKPEPETLAPLTEYVVMGNKKEAPPRIVKQMSSDSSEPDWDSDEDKEVKLVSKKINEEIVEKINAVTKKQPSKRLDDLQRHEKQFLEEYYRRKRLEEQNGIQREQIVKQSKKVQKKQQKIEEKKVEIAKNDQKTEQKPKEQEQQWAEYDPKVGALITGGFIQKVQKGQDDDFEMDDDFSYQQQKSAKQQSSSSDDDDMFADEGPRTIAKTKTPQQRQQEQSKKQRKEIVQISSHKFTQIAQEIGTLPESCTWIISNKHERYRLSTQYMNEYYQNLSKAFPYVSLNHSEFVHCDEIQTERGLDKLRRSDHKRRTHNNYNNNSNNNNNSSSKNKTVSRPQPSHYKQKK